MNQDQIWNSKYVWSISVISIRFCPAEKLLSLITDYYYVLFPVSLLIALNMLSWMWCRLLREYTNCKNGLYNFILEHTSFVINVGMLLHMIYSNHNFMKWFKYLTLSSYVIHKSDYYSKSKF